MFQVTLTAYGQSIASDLINIDGVILLYEKVTVASLSDISSYTVVHDEEACGNLKNNVGNVFITDLSSNTYLAKSVLFYKNDGGQKRIVAGYSADSAVVKKTEQILNICLSFDFSAFTHGFLFSSIQATSSTASHNSDGIVHIEDPTVDSDNTYSVYSKQQVDALLEDYVTTNDLETNVQEFLEEHQNTILAGNNITITSSSSLLPTGYAQVEYIQSNGASYLDTGIVPTDNTKIVLDIFNNTTGSFYAIGARTNSSSTILLAQSGSSTGSTVLGSFNGTSLTAKTNNTSWSRTAAGQRYLIDIETNSGTGTYSVYDYSNDREFNAQTSYTQLGTQTSHICVLGFNSSNVLAGTSKVYRCEIYQNTVMAFQGIPCYRISDGVYGLYDIVSNTFKTSATSTELTGSTEIHDTLTISSKDEKAQWGKITGTLSNQTDLNTALGLKANSADLATVATSGSYNDLSNKPTIPTVNDSTITIKKNSSDTGDSFTTNASSGKTINLGLSTVATSGSYNDLSNKPSIPTDTSDLTNGAGYITGYTETDPTVPSWAKQDNKPTYTLDEVSDGSTRKLSNYVPTTRTVNSKALSSNITINLDDVSDGTTRKLSNYVPTTRTVNSKALSSNITLTLDDIADGTSRKIPTVNNATLTIQKNGTTVKTFTANASSNVTANITVPTTVAELSDASNYVQASSLTSLVATAQYNSTDKTIEFYNAAGTKLNTDIDATAFIKDGMVDNVEITNGKLVISFNTDSGKEDIEIPISDIFDASNYYTKSQVDGLIPTVNNSTITIKKNSSDTGDSFTTNAASGKAINLGLHAVATSGSYNDLTNKPTIPTDTSDLTNGAGYITGYTETDPTVPAWAKESSKPSYTLDEVSDGTTRKLSNYVPTTRKVNNKALSSDITLSLDDVADGSSRSIPTNVSELYNDSGYLTEHQDISGKQDVLTAGEGIAITSDIVKTTGIPFGIVDSTSTSTVYTVTVPGIYKLEDGVCCLVKNGVVTSASGFTLNVNGLGAKPCYSNMAAATRETTAFNVNYTILFVYDSTRVSGGAWIYYRGYYSDANSIAYQIRGNTHALPTTGKFVRYRLLFTSADGTHFIPSNISTSTNATAKRDVVQTPIDPFGEIVYYSTTAAVDVGASPGATYLWTQYAITLGYSFNRTGAALVLTFPAPIYLKCTPQSNGSAIIDADNPYVQALPNTADGKIYIFLGIATSAVAVELLNNHPIYYHDGTGIRIWTGKDCYSKSDADAAFVPVARTVNSKSLSSDITLNLDDVLDGSSRVIPTDTGDLTNNAGFITSASLPTVNDSTITIKKTASDTGDSFTTNNATAKTINLDLHTVATSGSYNDLRNKPTIPTVNNAKLTIKKTSTDTGTEFTANASTDVTCNLDLATVATSGSYNDLDGKPTIPTVNNSTIIIKANADDTGDSFTTNASSGKTINLGLADVAVSGSYNDLKDTPTIPTVNNASLTITKGGTNDTTTKTFTANASQNVEIHLGLGGAADKAVDSTIADSSTSANLPTSQAVASFVEGKGYLTSYTETDPTVPSWAKASVKPSYTLDEVLDGSTRKLSNYVPTSRKVNNKALSSDVTLTLDDVADGTSRSIPTVNNATLTIQKNGTTVKTFTANASSNVTANITVPLESISVDGTTQTITNRNVDLHIPADITNSELIGGFVRYNVSGSGNLTISNTYGLFPHSGGSTTTLPAGTYLVRVRLRSTTSSYSVTVNFGTPYTISTSNGVIDDLRSVTLSSAQGFSASITQVNANTYIRVVLYEPGEIVTSVGTAATTNDYNDLDNIPNGTLVIQRNGSNVASFSASADSNVTANITVPTTVASLTDAGNYVTTNTAQNITGDKTINEKDLFISDSQSTPVTDTVDAFVMKRGQEFIAGTQTSSTGSWAGVTKQSAIYDGMCINYYLPYAGSGSASLTLTLPNNTTTDAIPIYCYSSSGSVTRLSTHFPRGSVIQMTLLLNRVIGSTTYTAAWVVNAYYYYDSNTYDKLLSSSAVKAGINGIKGYTLVLRTGDDTWESIVNSNSTGTDKTANTSGFYLDTVYYYNSSSSVSSGNLTYSMYTDYSNVYANRYFNLSSTLTNAVPVYLIFTYNSSTGKFYLDTTRWWTQSPISESSTAGKYFLYIGRAYTSGSDSYVSLENNHPLFYVRDSALKQTCIDNVSGDVLIGKPAASDHGYFKLSYSDNGASTYNLSSSVFDSSSNFIGEITTAFSGSTSTGLSNISLKAFGLDSNSNVSVKNSVWTIGELNYPLKAIYATNFYGTATNATYVNVSTSSSSTDYPLVFTSTVASGNKTLYTDTANSLSYNPSTNKLAITGYWGNSGVEFRHDSSSSTVSTYIAARDNGAMPGIVADFKVGTDVVARIITDATVDSTNNNALTEFVTYPVYGKGVWELGKSAYRIKSIYTNDLNCEQLYFDSSNTLKLYCQDDTIYSNYKDLVLSFYPESEAIDLYIACSDGSDCAIYAPITTWNLGTYNYKWGNIYATDIYANKLSGLPIIPQGTASLSSSTWTVSSPSPNPTTSGNPPTGAIVCVYFSSSNSVSSPQLKFGSWNAKYIRRTNSSYAGIDAATSWESGTYVLFRYGGSYWYILNYNTSPTSTASGTTNIIPSSDATYDLGSSNYKWDDIFVNYVGSSSSKVSYGYFNYCSISTLRNSSNTNTASITAADGYPCINPNADATSDSVGSDLGTSSARWRSICGRNINYYIGSTNWIGNSNTILQGCLTSLYGKGSGAFYVFKITFSNTSGSSVTLSRGQNLGSLPSGVTITAYQERMDDQGSAGTTYSTAISGTYYTCMEIILGTGTSYVYVPCIRG